MRMKYETRIALKYLRSKRKEKIISITTWISIVGIAIGVMALIVVIAVMTGFQDEIRDRILGINPHIVIFGVGAEIKDPKGVVDTVRTVDGVTQAFPFSTFQAMVQHGRQLSGAIVRGVNLEDTIHMKGLVKEGNLSAIGIQNTVLIGKELAKHTGLVPGSSFSLMVPFGGFSPMGAMPETVRLRVGGILDTGMYEVDNSLIVMSLRDVEAIMGVGASGVEIKLKDVYRADATRKTIMEKLGSSYFSRTWIEMNRNLFSALKLEKLIMFIILGLIIFVASFNIVSSLIMTVMEKKKDIAILRAMGAGKKSIVRIFMNEGLTIGVIGVCIGSVAGYVLCEIQRHFKIARLPEDIYNLSALPVKISFTDMVLVVFFTMVICTISTLYPSWKAAKIDPVETLRYE